MDGLGCAIHTFSTLLDIVKLLSQVVRPVYTPHHQEVVSFLLHSYELQFVLLDLFLYFVEPVGEYYHISCIFS